MTDLRELISADFETDVIASTPEYLRHRLVKHATVAEIGRHYRAGTITEEDVRQFVAQILLDSRGEDPFPFQVALAAIAVILEEVFSPFADEYLTDLGRLSTNRFSMASRVARLCVAKKQQFPLNKPPKFAFLDKSAAGRPFCPAGRSDVGTTYEPASGQNVSDIPNSRHELNAA